MYWTGKTLRNRCRFVDPNLLTFLWGTRADPHTRTDLLINGQIGVLRNQLIHNGIELYTGNSPYETQELDNERQEPVAQAAVTAALGMPICVVLGAGAGVAIADPGQPCWAQNCQGDHRGDGGQDHRPDVGDDGRFGGPGRRDQWRPDQGGGDQRRWDQRGVDDARFDHQPFNWQGQRVEPYWDQDRGAGPSGFSACGFRCDVNG
jgi:hypothetical protein